MRIDHYVLIELIDDQIWHFWANSGSRYRGDDSENVFVTLGDPL